MRISYENGKLYYSITKDEFAEINKDLRPTEIDIMWLPHLLKDISDANYQHWRKKNILDQIERNTPALLNRKK
tara:strand:- start:1352 stop:1570 length:219 start_codon:yes stop_codon:yes gene_type:complete